MIQLLRYIGGNPHGLQAMFLCGLMLLLGATATRAEAADRGSCFLKNGDRWLLIGDSITNIDTYRQAALRVLQLYHPDADIMVGNSAVSGVTADYKEKRAFTPTVVTIMLGMNDIIHQDWAFTPDITQKTEAYRKDITEKVQRYQKLGAEVILLTPTYTDERFSTFFNVAMTRRFLEAYGKVIREIAATEHCHWLPVAEELEAFQDTLGIDQHVRHDGVHPNGLGQYQIARTLWQHMNFAGKLDGSRRMVTPAEPLPLNARLASRFMHTPDAGVTLLLSTAQAHPVTATWRLGEAHGSETLSLGPQETSWHIPVLARALEVPLGSLRRMVVEFDDGTRQRLCIIDLARTRVLHMKNGTVAGEIHTEEERPEGKLVARWKLEDIGNELWISGEVFDSELVWDTYWPFSRDGVQIWLDPRPAARFADINPDRDVSDLLLTVRDVPYFSVAPVAWINPRLMYAVTAGGEKTPTGYRWHCGIGGKLSDVRALDLDKRDYFGINIIVCDSDKTPKPTTHMYITQQIDAADQMNALNLLMIVDRKGIFPGDETTNLHLFAQ